jgi:hypothetical protein
MPIRKFRTIEEMNAADSELWSSKPDAAYYQRVRKLWETSARLNPRTLPKGVFKFRSLEEAQAQRDRLLAEHIRKTRAAAGDRVVQPGDPGAIGRLRNED